MMCETRDLGIRWPHWHTLVVNDETRIDMRCVCPKTFERCWVQRVRSVYWTTWAAKHDQEELKEGPAQALLRKKAKGDWTEKHRNVARKFFLEAGWTQNMGWSDVSQCQACQMEEGTEANSLPLSRIARSKVGYSGALQKMGAKGENVEESVDVIKSRSRASSQ